MKKSIIILMALGFFIALGTAYGAMVDLQGPSQVDPNQQSTFFFSVVTASEVGDLENWDAWGLILTLGGGTNANFQSFRSVLENEDYVFFNNSKNYQAAVEDNTAIANDDTASGSGVEKARDKLLAQVTVNIENAKQGEAYTISLEPADGNNFFDTGNISEAITQNGIYSFEVVPIPATIWLLCIGLVGLWGLRRKLRN
jgi:hypothetical protein